jgi:hypothetical protein
MDSNSVEKEIVGYRGYVVHTQSNGLVEPIASYFTLSQKDDFNAYLRKDVFDTVVVGKYWSEDKAVLKKSLEAMVQKLGLLNSFLD